MKKYFRRQLMSIENLIKDTVNTVGETTYLAPDIPNKKMDNALKAFGTAINPKYVIAITDSTLFKSAREGIIYTGEAIYINELLKKPRKILFKDIVGVEKNYFEVTKKIGPPTKKNEVMIELINNDIKVRVSSVTSPYGTLDEIVLTGLNEDAFGDLIQKIIEEIKTNVDATKVTDQHRPLSDMSENTKLNYMKVVINYIYSSENEIDSDKYSQIMSLVAQNSLSLESRSSLRPYIGSTEKKENTTVLLNILKDNCIKEESNFELLKLSLLKDILNLFFKNNESYKWEEDKFILDFKENLNIDSKQVVGIIELLNIDKNIIKNKMNDNQIKKTMTDISAQAVSVGVPLAAIYFSGSVVGVGATGITSGLAALGMGGVIGLSSMATGIGMLAFIGVGTYKGIKKFSAVGESEKNTQRELLLQHIIKNQQLSITFMIEDINEVTKDLISEVGRTSLNQQKLARYAEMMRVMTSAAKKTSNKRESAEKEQISIAIPKYLNIERLNELTSSATNQEIEKHILSCYEKEDINSIDKNREENSKERIILKENLSKSNLEQLKAEFNNIQYDTVSGATKAALKNSAKNILGHFSQE
ncbi:hypothetical protein [Carnobacterium sp. TMP28]|uniref:hypothetical protein n=1 Tax=Carnobacterium sp. TMP28 TaxID=3397060 RepID=UPI0039E0AC6C